MNNRQLFKIFNSAKKEFALKNDSSGTAFGKSIVEYEIYKRTDVSNLKNVKGYVLAVQQRLIIPNMTKYTAGSSTITSYDDYPAIIENQISIDVNNGAQIQIDKIFPRTLNSNVTTNSTSSSAAANSITHQNTVGSSTSNVNTFGVTIAGGFFGELPVGELALSYSHSWIKDESRQSTHGGSTTSQTDTGFSNSMSVKDWSAYSSLSNDNKSLTWFWGQSYPWDVILYNQSGSGDNINLPKFVAERLISDGMVLPPSELSLFGLDFTNHAAWIIDFPDGLTEDEVVKISHKTTSYTASHSLSGDNKISAKLQSVAEANSAEYSPGALDLSLYSLATIGRYPVENIATIGFQVDNFTYSPKTSADKFKVVSPINDLQAMGTGFDSNMTALFKSEAVVDIYFKIEDSSFNYALNLIHWIGENSEECRIEWTVNDKYTGCIVIGNVKNAKTHDNFTRIPLRDLDYTSVNFYDYLVIGLNRVTLSITPVKAGQNNEYTLSSISIR